MSWKNLKRAFQGVYKRNIGKNYISRNRNYISAERRLLWTHHLRVLNLSWRLALYHLFLYDKDLPVKKGFIISAFHKSKPCKHIIKMFAPFLDTFKTFTIRKTNQILLLCFLKLLHLLISQFWNSSRKMIYSSLAKTWGWKRTKRRIFLESTDTTLR